MAQLHDQGPFKTTKCRKHSMSRLPLPVSKSISICLKATLYYLFGNIALKSCDLQPQTTLYNKCHERHYQLTNL